MARGASRFFLLISLAWLFYAGPETSRAAAPSDETLLTAENVDYDQKAKVVIATGNVELVHGKNVVLADQLVYDNVSEQVTAIGNVSILEPAGNVIFAERTVLKRDFSKGVAHAFQARLKDNSLLAAKSAERINPDVMKLYDAVYSPCSAKCSDGTATTPIWQIRAQDATLDEAKHQVTYHNARMEAAGIPVLYTPYFSHSTPGAANESGLLTPEYYYNRNLGNVAKIPLYIALGRDRDITLTPMIVTAESPVILGEYRQRFDHGTTQTRASFTRPQKRDNTGQKISGDTTRGHVQSNGQFEGGEEWRWGWDVNRTSDDTYLRLYRLNNETLLTSRAYADATPIVAESDRAYGRVQALAFQGLLSTDNNKQSPRVLPQLDAEFETTPLAYGARAKALASAVSITRKDGTDMRRVTAGGGLGIPYISKDGHVFEARADIRSDVYSTANFTLPGAITGTHTETSEMRMVPQASAGWRYPLQRTFEDGTTFIVEPQVLGVISPTGNNPFDIPNEDSVVAEVTDANLFSAERNPGFDRVEEGPRVNYGVRTYTQLADGTSIGTLVGQTYRTDANGLFPYTTRPGSHVSDIVAQANAQLKKFQLGYEATFDNETFDRTRNIVNASAQVWRLNPSVGYFKREDTLVTTNQEELSVGNTVKLSREWAWSLGARRNLELDRMVSASSGLQFQNECLTLLLAANRDYTNDRDIRSATSFGFNIFFKNLN